MNVLSRPWCHFLALGLLIYMGQALLQPEAMATVQPPSEERVAQLHGQWLRSTGRPPSAAQLQALINQDIDQEILFQEALKRGFHLSDSVVRQRLLRDMRFLNPDNEQSDRALFEQALDLQLHLNDTVVKRRLIQMMELVASNSALEEPTQQDLVTLFQAFQAQRPEKLMHPATLNLEHLFLQGSSQGIFARAQQQLKALQQGEPPSGDSFLHGLQFERLNEGQAAQYFGADFASLLFQAASQGQSDNWFGPVASVYGWHLVKLSKYQTAREKTLPELRVELTAMWQRQQQQKQLQQLLVELRQHYEVRL